MKREELKKIRFVTVYCSSHMPNSPEYADAVAEFGKYLAKHGMTLVYGGCNAGLMKLLVDSVLENGGSVNGVFPATLPTSLQHPGLTDCTITRNLPECKAELLRQADVVVVLPGSFGTWDELFDAFALRRSKRAHKPPVGILNINGYFDPLLAFMEQNIQLGFTNPKDRNLLKVAKTPALLLRQLAGSMVSCQTDGSPDLKAALQKHDVPKVKMLLRSGMSPNACFEIPGFTPLYYARGSKEMLKMLLEYGANAQDVGKYIWTFLAKQDEKGMRYLVEQGLDVTWFEPDGTSPLSGACAGGFGVDTLRLLIEHGAHLSRKTLDTALICACGSRKDTGVLHFLLALGADPKRQKIGRSCMELAIDRRCPLHVEFLLEHGVCLHPKRVGKRSFSYLERAAVDQYGYPVLKVLLAAGADIDCADKNGEHVLFTAVRYGSLRTIKALVNAGIDVNLRNGKGERAVDVCDLERARGRSIQSYLQKVISQRKIQIGRFPLPREAGRARKKDL